MKHTLRIKWLASGIAALSFAGSVEAVTNDLNAAHKATLERDIGLLNTGKTVNVSYLKGEAWRMIDALEKSGDRSLLPYFAEISLDAANPETVRSHAAAAYIKSVTAEECATFLPKILKIDDVNKKIISWRYDVTPACLNKIEAAITKQEMSKDTLARLVDALVMYTQFAYSASEARHVDDFLVRHCEGYPTSWQRLTLWTKILDADKKNEVKWKNCLPIKQSVEAVPPRKRVDLRKRFPDLPPLPEDKNAGRPLKVTLAIVSAFVAVCVAVWIAAKRMKTQTHEKE